MFKLKMVIIWRKHIHISEGGRGGRSQCVCVKATVCWVSIVCNDRVRPSWAHKAGGPPGSARPDRADWLAGWLAGRLVNKDKLDKTWN